MADAKLRELERRWQTSGTPADEAAWLRERVRSGDPWPERITFAGNPWPAGHRIEELRWTARLVPESGIWFDLNLESADYYEDDDAEDEADAASDWEARIVWGNYHACRISSESGFRVGTADAQLDFDALAGRAFHVDPPPIDVDDHDARVFSVYLLGHDTVADHRIRFDQREDASTWWLSWRGKIALTYSGQAELAHTFEIPLRRVRFEGIALPGEMSEDVAREHLARFVVRPEQLAFATVDGSRRFVL